jgi:hypothetical protein
MIGGGGGGGSATTETEALGCVDPDVSSEIVSSHL